MKNFFVAALLALAAVGGCKKDDNPASSGDSGTMQVSMVDAPASAYDSVMITVTSVAVHSASSESWITLSSQTHTYNLLSLVNGVEAVLGEAHLSAGTYTQMRLTIGDSCYVYASGVKFALTVPSSEIKLNINAEIKADIVYKLVLDFDANRSIVANANGLLLKPVIRAVAKESTGFITGSVNTKASVYAYGAQDTVSTTTGANNEFKLMYVKPGAYTVAVIPANIMFYDTTFVGVNVVQGQTTSLGTVALRSK